MEHITIDGLLGAAEEACRAGRLREAQSLVDQWSISSPKSAAFRAVPRSRLTDDPPFPLEVPNADRQSRLENAAEEGYSFLVSFLLEQGAEIMHLVVKAACDSNSTEVFQAMLDHGWNINEQYWGSTSLRYDA
jgi:hypothetical protein